MYLKIVFFLGPTTSRNFPQKFLKEDKINLAYSHVYIIFVVPDVNYIYILLCRNLTFLLQRLLSIFGCTKLFFFLPQWSALIDFAKKKRTTL